MTTYTCILFGKSCGDYKAIIWY